MRYSERANPSHPREQPIIGARGAGASEYRHMSKNSRALRVELEMRSRFLRHYKINDPYDFGKLVQILPKRHIHFVRFNQKKLLARLRGMRFSPEKVWEILEDVALLEDDVWATLNYLVLDALKKWAAMWPTTPAKLKRK